MGIVISEVRIKNFRSLKDVTVKLSPNITLLVGANNAGKSTFLRALNIALNVDRKFIGLDDLFINKDGQQLPKSERIIRIDIKIVPETGANEFEEKWIQDFVTTSNENNGREMFAFRTKIDFSENSHSAKIQRFILRAWDNSPISETDSDILQGKLENIPFYFIDAQRDLYGETTQRTSDFGRLANKVEFDETVRSKLEGMLSVLNEEAVKQSSVLGNLKTNLEKLNQTISNSVNGVQITPFPKKVRDLSKGMKVHFQDGDSDSFGLEYHGMGTRSWASLLTFKAMIEQESIEKENEAKPFHPTLGLEEPEAHLHPNAQRQVYSQLIDINGQKIISTHSPYIVAQAELGELRHFRKRADETVVNYLNIETLNLDEKQKIKREAQPTGELLFSKAIILFEGETEYQSFPIFAYKYWNGVPYEISFIKADGNNYKPFLLFAEAMNIPWFIFSDYDKPNIKKCIDNLHDLIGLDKTSTYPNIIKLGIPIEQYLIQEGYQTELKLGINNWYLDSSSETDDPRQIDAGQKKINSYDDTNLLKDLSSDGGKVRYPTYWASAIISIPDENRTIPTKIKSLFKEVNKLLIHTPNISEDAQP